MSKPTKAAVRKFMVSEVSDRNHPDLWDDCGQVNCTRLAENAAWHFNHDEWLDDETHWVWVLAVDVARRTERQPVRERSGTGLNNARSPFGPWG